MKLTPKTTSPRGNDAINQGMDAALTLLLFFGVGFGLDRWLGTTPWLMIAMSLLAAVGVFIAYKYRYDAAMDRLDAERAERAERRHPRRSTP